MFDFEPFILRRALVQLTGFVFLILGNFTYNEVLVVKWWDLDRDTQTGKLARMKKEFDEDLPAADTQETRNSR